MQATVRKEALERGPSNNLNRYENIKDAHRILENAGMIKVISDGYYVSDPEKEDKE